MTSLQKIIAKKTNKEHLPANLQCAGCTRPSKQAQLYHLKKNQNVLQSPEIVVLQILMNIY